MKYLIDTDWVVDYLKGRAPATALMESLAQEDAAISIITYGEIYEGIHFGRERAQHERGFRGFLQIVGVLTLDQFIMEQFAQIRGDLRAQGQIIGDLDLLIAATALTHDLAVATLDEKHFARIPRLGVVVPR